MLLGSPIVAKHVLLLRFQLQNYISLMAAKFLADSSWSETLPIEFKAWFKRRILHAPNQILILVDLNEYVRLIWFKRRIVLPNKIAERERRVLNSHSSEHNYLT